MTTELQTLESLGLQNKENLFEGFFSYKPSWLFTQFINRHERIICLFTGNQRGKTSLVAYSYVMRIMGMHPIEAKNMRPNKKIRTYRFASESLPADADRDEQVRNTQYPEFKKWLPPCLIKKDITARSPVITLFDPQGGPDINIEFVSYNQTTQSQAGQKRASVWCVAEGQRVLLSNGVWRNIENIEKGDELICESLGGHGTSQKTNKVKDIIYNGEREVIRIKCQKGIQFEVTSNHKIMIPGMGKSSYIEAGKLQVGDKVKCKLSKIDGEKTLNDWIVIFTAIILGDGWTTGGRLHFACANDELLQDLKKKLPDHLKVTHRNPKGAKEGACPQYTIISKYHSRCKTRKHELLDYFKKEGLIGKLAGSKFVPDTIFEQDNKTIALFLKYLYATDGWAGGHTIGYCSTSYKLAQDVYLLLRRLGIRSTICERRFTNNWNVQWWVLISTSYDVINFIEKVGIACKDVFIDKVYKEAIRRNRVRMAYFYERQEPLKDKYLKEYVKIKSIEKIGKKKVYDITMESGGWEYNQKKGRNTSVRKVAVSPRNNFLIQGGVVVHNCDESASKEFYEEQLPRLLASDGDLIYTLTPAEYVGFEFDEFFEKASIYIREQAVCDRMFERTGKKVKRIEKTDSNSDVAVLMAATDGNPIYPDLVAEKNTTAIELIKHGRHPTVFKVEDYQMVTVDDYIGEIIGTLDDETVDIRRYGLFRQSSGQIFKDFDVRIHVISANKYFTEGVPHGWIHARGIDYHEHVPWAVGFTAISPQNEVFVYDELNPSPEKMVTLQIAQIIANKSRDFKFKLNLIDPLAAKKQSNTGLSTIDDLNRIFNQLRKDGICTGGYWQSWDTRSTRGREEVRSRLRNSKLVGTPFSNRVVKNGVTEYLPTLWMLDNCYNFKESFKNWRREEWANRESLLTKDEKDQPQQRYSHFPMVIEALFKHPAFSSGRYRDQFVKDRDTKHKHYFQREAYG